MTNGESTPNVVLIITDNQSTWTLGCYGNREILTPNIDQLAQEGVRFSNSFCTNPVCSPNRATCMTGLMPSQHGVHNWLGGEEPDAQVGPQAYCTIEEFAALPRILSDRGYAGGMSGKWHLGDSLHPQLGFDYWFCKPYGHTSSFYNSKAVWQEQIYIEPRYYTDVITEHAVDFLNQAHESPFFLYVGYNGPYGLDNDLREGHRNRHTAYYADKPLRCFPREEVHPWLNGYLENLNNETSIRSYAAAVSGVDDGVGKIMDTLVESGLDDNTLVVYTADHGLCAGHHGWWGMADHGRPLMMYDENLRIPLIIRHPGHIAAGDVCDAMTCNYDLFPSLLDYLKLQDEIPAGPELPGRSYAPALAGDELDWDEEVTFHEYENTRTVRTARWKYTRRFPEGPDDLYDMHNDPGERQNLIDLPEHSAVRQKLGSRLDTFFTRYSEPEYDLWQGGTSKAHRCVPEF
jgi:arylsulfatase A-like enzyme